MHRLSSGPMSIVIDRYTVYRTAAIALVCVMLACVLPAELSAQGSPHGPLKQQCTDCHTTASWKDLAVPMKFNHTVTGFPLQGSHANVSCLQCHTAKRFAGTSAECFSCHKKDFGKALSPNHQTGLFSHECTTCHTNTSWRPSIFDHAKTNFSLTGAHSSVECSSCHINDRFKGLSADCFACHQKDYAAVKTPDHAAAKFDRDCLTCHSNTRWQPSTFDHNRTQYPLTGAHRAADCSSCHSAGKFKGTAQDCYSCHQKDFNGVTTPNHRTAMFDRNCLTCHTMNSWTPSTFDHAKTEFSLTGAHTTADCSKCHGSGSFNAVSKECFACHQKDIASLPSPDHVKGQFSQDCLTCHTTAVWKPSTFDHAKTNYPLQGAHRATECAKCHVNEQYKSLPNDCYTCHQKEFTETLTPNHVTGQLSHQCLDCHTTTVWKPSTFDHNKSLFKLVGAHISADCATCHGNGQFKGLPVTCYACHQKDYTAAAAPNHVAGQFSQDCLTCHTQTGWKPASFNHNVTQFPLTGAHAAVNCTSCHTNGRYSTLPKDCYSCHQASFAGVTVPNHISAQFSHDCLSCHSSTAWSPSTFNHAVTAFPLLGAHTTAGCSSCHTNGQFKGLPSDCYSCHQKNFTATTAPNHVTAQFSHECLTCHTNTAWKPSTFNHASTSFPLLGSHAAVSCGDCHKNGQFKGTTTDCYACHLADFTGVTDPNHVTNQFDHNCLTCHSMNGWTPASFDHNKSGFPLTGAHVAASCANCHKNGTYSGTTTDCYTCHTSDYTSAASPAHAAANYPKTCLTCHNTAAWKPSTFNHTPYFPIGAGDKHRPGRWTTCADCHTNPTNYKVFSCIDCHEHNKTSMDNEHRGRSGYVYESASCYRCHPTGRE